MAPLVGAALAGLIYRGFVVPEGDSGKKPAAAEVDSVELADADEEADTEEADAPAPAKAAAKPVPARSVVADEPVVDPEAKDFFDGPAKGSAGDKK